MEILRALFPYAINDAQLEPLFRTFVEQCRDDDDNRSGTRSAAAAPAPLVQLELPPDPVVEDNDDDGFINPA